MVENPRRGVHGPGHGRVPLGFGNLYASLGDHIRHFYQTNEERTSVVASFIKAGLEAGDKCVYFMNPGPRRELENRLADAAVTIEDAMASGQLILQAGESDPGAMQDALGSALAEIPERFPLLRWGGDMTWSLGKLPTAAKLMECETH